jgi:Ca2+-transporting ATPase
MSFIGLLMAIGTLYLEARYEATADITVALTVGFVVFSLFNIIIGLSTRSETASAFNREIISDRHQLSLYGLSLLMIILATRLDFLQSILGLTGLNADQWIICIAFAIALLLVDEVIKVFLRRRRREATDRPAPQIAAEQV